MAAERPRTTKATGPEWLHYTALRADEFARQARLYALPLSPPPPHPIEGDEARRRLLAAAGHGLNYQVVMESSSPSEAAHQTLAYTHARPASFAPRQHIFCVLGRPCVVFMEKIRVPCAWLTLHTRAHRRDTLMSANLQPSSGIINETEPESTTRLIFKLCFLSLVAGTRHDARVVETGGVQRLPCQGLGSSDSDDGAWSLQRGVPSCQRRYRLVVRMAGPHCDVALARYKPPFPNQCMNRFSYKVLHQACSS